MWRSIVIAFTVLVVAICGSAAAAPAAGLVSSRGGVADGERTEALIWFRLHGKDQRFVVEPAQLADPAAFWAAIKASSETGHSLTVSYDPDGGFIDPATMAPTFPALELAYDGRTIPGPPRQDARRSAPTPEGLLARAVALAGDDDIPGAREALLRALSSDGLDRRLHGLGLKTRGDLSRRDAEDQFEKVGPDRDRLLVAALDDYLAWDAMLPENAQAKFAIGEAFRELGAYDEALSVYRQIIATGSEQAFWAHIRIGLIHRTLGQPDQSLKDLDALVAALGPQEGMAYHYHRGWSLAEAGRATEAVSELTAGIASQPDYSWAYLRRACALASLGRLPEALADQERGLELLKPRREARPLSPRKAHELRWASAEVEVLRAAAAADPKAKLERPCTSSWEDGARRRARSPLLSAEWASRHAPPAEEEPEPPAVDEPERTPT